MEPKLPAPNLGPEYPAPHYEQSQEIKPSVGTVETGIEQGAERFEQRSEVTPMAPATPVLPAPVPVMPPAPVATPTVDDTPLVANDDDLIEKEWVDKAKKIIVQTKDDPYMREQEVGKLQADYLLKRYGKELGAS
jgi:hypothetical protein